MGSRRTNRFLIASIALVFVVACDEQGSFGNTVQSQIGDRVDRIKRGVDGIRNRRDRRRERRGNRRGSRSGGELLPHRADYVIEVSGYSSARFATAKGTLTIDLIDDCDDWTLQEKLDVVLRDQADKIYRSNLLYRATEKASVDRFTFAYSRDHLGLREDFIGDSRPAAGGFLASFIEPEIADLALPGDVIYPVSHFRQVIADARRQRGSAETVVFDGGNDIAYQAVTDIGRPLRSNASNPRVVAAREMLDKTKSDRLPPGKTWPVTINYYPLNDSNAVPIFTRDLILHETGIIVGLHFDYGDFQMDASLANLDIFEPTRCTEEKRR